MFYDPLTGHTRIALVLTTDAGPTIAGADGSITLPNVT
jgi:hypothetical protein